MESYKYHEAVIYDNRIWCVDHISTHNKTMWICDAADKRILISSDLRLIRVDDQVLCEGQVYRVKYLNRSFGHVDLWGNNSRITKRVSPCKVSLFLGTHNENFLSLLHKE